MPSDWHRNSHEFQLFLDASRLINIVKFPMDNFDITVVNPNYPFSNSFDANSKGHKFVLKETKYFVWLKELGFHEIPKILFSNMHSRNRISTRVHLLINILH